MFVFIVAYFIDFFFALSLWFRVVLAVVCCQNRVWICVSCVQSSETHSVNDVALFALDLTSYNEFSVVASLKSVTYVARISVEYCYVSIWLLL